MNKEIVSKKLALGQTYQEIGDFYGISRQAVWDFCKRKKLFSHKQGGYEDHIKIKKESFVLGPETYLVAAERYRRKRQNAKNSKWEFTIAFEEIEWPTHCPILGLELDYFNPTDKKVENSISFDRIDPTKGYIPGNVQILSWRANRIKNDGSAEEHRKIADYLDKRLANPSIS